MMNRCKPNELRHNIHRHNTHRNNILNPGESVLSEAEDKDVDLVTDEAKSFVIIVDILDILREIALFLHRHVRIVRH